jgi:lysophospholipase L1-like esterase
MFKSHYRPRSRPRPLFSKRKSKRINFSIVSLSISILVITVLLEVLTRILVGFSDRSEHSRVKSLESPEVSAYRFKFVNEKQQDYTTLPRDGNLVAQRSLSVGYQLLGKQENQYWQINEQSFRDRYNLPVDKPKNEIRVFVFGGSTAFGQLNSSNNYTISSQLQALLQSKLKQQQQTPEVVVSKSSLTDTSKPEVAIATPPKLKPGKYRVINAGVPGYTSGNSLAQLAIDILPYKPDLIIVLDGYADLMLPSEAKLTDIPSLEKYINNPLIHFRDYLSQVFKPVVEYSALAKQIQSTLTYKQPLVAQTSLVFSEENKPIEKYFPEDKKELQRRVDRYFDNHRQMARLAAGARIPLVIAVQPEITGHIYTKLSPPEKEIVVQLGRKYIHKMKSDYSAFLESSQLLQKYLPKNVKVINFYSHTDKFPTPIFNDAIHLTDRANSAIAQELLEAIVSLPKMQVETETPDSTSKPNPLPRVRKVIPRQRNYITPRRRIDTFLNRKMPMSSRT